LSPPRPTRRSSLPLQRPLHSLFSFSFFFHDPAPTEIYTLSLHDALPISGPLIIFLNQACDRSTERPIVSATFRRNTSAGGYVRRSEEHTSELQSRENLVCRLLLEKKKKRNNSLRVRVMRQSSGISTDTAR